MQFLVPLKYIYKCVPFFFTQSDNFSKNTTVLFIPNFSVYFISFFFKYSFFFKNFLLLDVGSYEIPTFLVGNGLVHKNILWYIFKNMYDNFMFLFTVVNLNYVHSIDVIYRNAKWLEREVSEFFNVYFKNKKDRRSLFTIPIFYEAPFRKKFPTVGFYEIFVCFFTKKIKFKHVSFKN